MLTTISDRKTPNNTTIGAAVTYYKPVIVTANDYYPFGMLMLTIQAAAPGPGRNYNDASNKDYRYGFNGKENDNDVKGIEGGQQDYGMRIYDPRLGRFLSVDPLTHKYSMLTPYQFSSNTPIQALDLDGAEANYVNGGTGVVYGPYRPGVAQEMANKHLVSVNKLGEFKNGRYYVPDPNGEIHSFSPDDNYSVFDGGRYKIEGSEYVAQPPVGTLLSFDIYDEDHIPDEDGYAHFVASYSRSTGCFIDYVMNTNEKNTYRGYIKHIEKEWETHENNKNNPFYDPNVKGDQAAKNFINLSLLGTSSTSPALRGTSAAATAEETLTPLVSTQKNTIVVLNPSQSVRLLAGNTSGYSDLVNRFNHIFGKAEHALGDLLSKFGSQELAFSAVQKAANEALSVGKLTYNSKGILPKVGEILNVEGVNVRLIGGKIEDGKVILSSFSRKGL